MKKGEKKWYKSPSTWATIIISILLVPVLLVNLFIIIQSKTNKDEIPSIFGYKPFIVLSGSMESDIHKGDLIITKKVKPENLEVDDIIAFRDAAGTVTTHRIIDIVEKNGKKSFITKGDNNSTQDRNLVALESVEGIYIGRVPGLGSMMDKLAEPTTIIILALGITMIFVIGFMISSKKQSELEKKEYLEFKLQKEKEEMLKKKRLKEKREKEELEKTQPKKRIDVIEEDDTEEEEIEKIKPMKTVEPQESIRESRVSRLERTQEIEPRKRVSREVEFEDDDIEVQNISSSFDVNPIITTNSEMSTVAAPSSVATETISTSKVEKLDDREKVFPSLSTIDNKYNGFENEGMVSDEITLEQLCHRFRNYLAKEEKLYFDIDTIRIFISGFAASHFMILEGLSGTGKSSLPRYFAKFVNGNSLFIPVQATWRDKTSILGYFNDFSKTYSETDFLIQLYEANYNPDQINLFVLDEMNISRVEYYFADFLSILEYPTPSWKLRIMQLPYQFIPPVKLQDGYIQIPTNSYFIGTANKDDSTFSITDKVYDRAITIDFDNRNIPFEVNEDASPIQLSHSKFNQLLEEASTHKEYQLTEKDYENFQKVCDFIYEEFDITFGNRVMNQISLLVPTFMACGGKKEDALDFLLSRKIIVKLEGRFEEYIKGGLKQLLQLLEKTYGSHTFEKSEKAIHNLMRKL